LRVFPKISADGPTALLGLICVAMFAGLLHQTAQWFVRESGVFPVAWKFQSTLQLFGIILLAFGAGTAMVGATHQFVWILSGRADRVSDEEAQAQISFGSIADLIRSGRDEAQRRQEKTNLKYIGLGLDNVSDVTHGRFPPGGLMDEEGTLLFGWPVFLSGYLGYYFQNGLADGVPWNRPPNDKYFKCQILEFVNPAQSGPLFDHHGFGLSHVAANIHVMPLSTIKRRDETARTVDLLRIQEEIKEPRGIIKISEITDGTSNTALMGTVSQNLKPWGHPANLRDPSVGMNRSPDGFGGPPVWKGGQMLMCDGSVRFVSDKIDLSVMKAIATPNGGETVSDRELANLDGASR
jgi:hypothetical protein